MKNAASEHQKLRKKIRKFTLKLAEIKKKNKKKIGSNVDNLRNLEPQPEQTFLIKKNKCDVPNSIPALIYIYRVFHNERYKSIFE